MYRQHQRGTSTVEFAIVAPLLFLILFGIIEFSLAFFNQALITNATREGARQGIVYRVTGTGQLSPLTNAEIITVVTDALRDPDTGQWRLISLVGNPTPAIPDPIRSGTGAGERLSVTVNYAHPFLVLPSIARLLGGNLQERLSLSATTVMRLE